MPQEWWFALLMLATIPVGIVWAGWCARCRVGCGRWWAEKRLGKHETKEPTIERSEFVREEIVGGDTYAVVHEDPLGNRWTSKDRFDRYRNVRYERSRRTIYPAIRCLCRYGCCKAEWDLDLPPETTESLKRIGVE